jgi:hypothetical protein
VGIPEGFQPLLKGGKFPVRGKNCPGNRLSRGKGGIIFQRHAFFHPHHRDGRLHRGQGMFPGKVNAKPGAKEQRRPQAQPFDYISFHKKTSFLEKYRGSV